MTPDEPIPDVIRRVFPDAKAIPTPEPPANLGDLAPKAAQRFKQGLAPHPRSEGVLSTQNDALDVVIGGFAPGEIVLATGADLAEVRKLAYSAVDAWLSDESAGRCVILSLRRFPGEVAQDFVAVRAWNESPEEGPLGEPSFDTKDWKLMGAWGSRVRIYGPQPRSWQVPAYLAATGEHLAMLIIDDLDALLAQAGSDRDEVWQALVALFKSLPYPVWVLSSLQAAPHPQALVSKPVRDFDSIILLEPSASALFALRPKSGTLGRVKLLRLSWNYMCAS